MRGLQILFWLAAAVLVYTFLGYPLLIAALARWLKRPVDRSPILPRMTLLIPAYNEAEVIARKIENALALDYPADRLEIVVITDGSDDETPDVVRRYAAEGVRLYHQPPRRGKMAAINRVMPLVEGEVVVMSDANAMINGDALRAIARNFADPEVGGVAGEKRVLGGGGGGEAATVSRPGGGGGGGGGGGLGGGGGFLLAVRVLPQAVR